MARSDAMPHAETVGMGGVLDRTKNSPVVVFLGAIVTGFMAGIGAYGSFLTINNKTNLVKGTFVPKSALMGQLLRTEVIDESRDLMDAGRNMDIDKKPDEGEAYLTRVEIFLRSLELPKVRTFGDEPMSVPAYTMH